MAYDYERRASATVGSLFDAKLEWAYQLALALAARLEGYGGWRPYRIKSNVQKTGRSVEFRGESVSHGFTLSAFITVEGQPVAQVMFTKQEPLGGHRTVDLLEVQKEIEDTSAKVSLGEHEPIDKIVMACSLFFSKFVNLIPR